MSQMTLPPSPPLLPLGEALLACTLAFSPKFFLSFHLCVEVSGVEGGMTHLNSTEFLIKEPSGLSTGGGPKICIDLVLEALNLSGPQFP